ncbi:uncharacterized protein LOC120110557 [Phoenix dactylifera]|uniref:Uncharacterized protein LOC120110557 n=1 Tax=Phoenix dactylifera TaxID=42345 RepID=A0A8B9A578_PHODC|nr:uncharacterized protein LOC120110557 [Phoenix dactylifera]
MENMSSLSREWLERMASRAVTTLESAFFFAPLQRRSRYQPRPPPEDENGDVEGCLIIKKCANISVFTGWHDYRTFGHLLIQSLKGVSSVDMWILFAHSLVGF